MEIIDKMIQYVRFKTKTRKTTGSILLITLTAICSSCIGPKSRPTPAPFVNPQAYLGYWYEIAYFPTFFQQGCRCSMISYVPFKKHMVLAATACLKKQRPAVRLIKIFPLQSSNHAKSKVEVFWPFRQEHWVLYVDSQYRYALTGTPNRRYLWLISRTPRMPRQQYLAILKLASKQGYNMSRLRITQQDCTPDTETRLMQAIRERVKKEKTRSWLK